MGGLEQHENDYQEPDDVTTADRNRRLGLILFLIYGTVYAGFVMLNAFRPQWAEWTPWRGINVAVIYGFLLIVGAFVLALIYGWACRNPAGDSKAKRNS